MAFIDKILYFGILSVIFLFPAYLFRFSVFTIPTTLVEVLIYILFFVWVYSVFTNKKKKKELTEFILKNRFIFFSIFLFVLSAFLASIFSENYRVSFGLFKAYFIDPVLFLFVFVFSFPKDKLNFAVASFLASSVIVAFVAYIYLFFGKVSYDGRLSGIFNSPNFLAMSLAPAIIFFIWSFLNVKRYSLKHRLVFFLLFLFFVIPFYFTFSFGSFIAVFVIFFVLLFFSEISKKLKFLIFFSLFVVFMFFLFLNMEKIQYFFNNDRSSFASREMIWKSSFEILKDNYIFGIAPGMFQDYYLSYKTKFSTPYLEWAVPYPHNIFLAFWIQNGILGILSFLFILFWLFKSIYKLAKKDKDVRFFSFFALFYILYILMHGLVDTPFWKNDLALQFFFFVGIILLLIKKTS